MTQPPRLTGLITRLLSGFYTVQTGEGEYICQLRGRLKKGAALGDIAALGDWVEISPHPDGSGSIESVQERKRALVRLAPTARGVYRQVLLANPDQVVFVYAAANPSPSLRMLDRFLVIAEKEQIPPLIVVNKSDLVSEERAAEMFSAYPPLGYPVIVTSAATGAGVEELRAALNGKISALAGPSGVGKSSLLNAIQPELGLKVSAISGSTSKGRHTTVIRQLFPLEGGGWVADMPGMRQLALWDTDPYELDGYFVEIGPLVDQCQYNDCTHRREPGCAVRKAVEEGRVSEERYISYLRLRYGDESD